MDFTKESCFACGNSFSKEDEVVVCPKCGTPYHRSCYAEAGECINETLHECGGKWKHAESDSTSAEFLHGETDEEFVEAEISEKICPKCGEPNDPNAKVCRKCGSIMLNNGNIADGIESMFRSVDEMCGNGARTDLNEDMGGATLKETAGFIGTNIFYYITKFRRMKDAGIKLTFNFACFLFPPFFFANRKMWFWGIITAVVMVVLELPSYLYLLSHDPMFEAEAFKSVYGSAINVLVQNENLLLEMENVFTPISFVLRILVALLANWFYYRFSMRTLSRIKSEGQENSFQRIVSAGGVKLANVLYMFIIMMFISAAVNFVVLSVLS